MSARNVLVGEVFWVAGIVSLHHCWALQDLPCMESRNVWQQPAVPLHLHDHNPIMLPGPAAGQSNAAQTLWDIPIMALDNSGGLSFVPQARAIMAAAARAPNPNIRVLQVLVCL